MISYHYNVCGLHLQVNTEKTLWEERQSSAFSAPAQQPDLIVSVRAVSALPPPPGALCSHCGERPVWRKDELVARGCRDPFRTGAHCCTCYRLSEPNRAECVVREEDWLWATRSSFFWPGIMFNYLLLHHRGLIFHASCIEHNGMGILFTAPSGTGKSTQADLWRVHRNAQIINGDKAGVTLRDTPTAHGVPFSGTSGICENRSLPLRGIAVLSQGPENIVKRLPPSQSVAALFPNLFVDRAISEEWQLALSLLLDLVSAVPVYALSCTPDVRAVEALERAMNL